MTVLSGIVSFFVRYKKVISLVFCSLLLCFVALLWVAEGVVERKIRLKFEQLQAERGVTIRYGDFKMRGFTTFCFEGVSVIPSSHDTLCSVQKMEITLRLLPLFVLRPDIESVQIEGVKVCFVKREGYCNYDFMFQGARKQAETKKEIESLHFAKLFQRLFDLFFRSMPDRLLVAQVEFRSLNNGYLTQLLIPHVELKDHLLSATLHLGDSTMQQTWVAEGRLDKSLKKIEGVLRGVSPQDTLCVPYFDRVYDAKVEFQALRFSLSVQSSSRKEVSFTGKLATDGLRINYWRLSSREIVPGNLAFEYSCRALPESFVLDSVSTLRFNEISIHPYISIRKDKSWGITCSVNEKSIPAQTLLRSLPRGLFETLDEVKLDGDFDYHFLFDLDLDRLDEVVFESGVTKNSIRIVQMGELSKLNAPFSHTAYKGDRPVRTFVVGESNPNYRPLGSISSVLQNAVLQSEDGQFYHHDGFQLDALREALAHDLKVRRFARGGSTISMQLIKNVFLNSRKNLFRKVEEAALVWLIENKRITSKARMYEVYLNLIEWGPNIYGVEEASRFYFAKSAADLTLQEALFLSSIIPNPALYRYAFDPQTGMIKENRTLHFRRVAYRLAMAGFLSEEEASTLVANVELKGAAKSSLLKSTNPSSLEEELEDEFELQEIDEFE